MEHFSDKEIILIVEKHLEVAQYVVISVPSNFFMKKEKIHGDERFLSQKKWRSLLLKVAIIVEEFSFNPEKDKPPRNGIDQFIGFVLTKNSRG